MSQHLLFQLKMARDWSIEVAESCPVEQAEFQLSEFNNTIQWHVGHILTVAERMLLNDPNKSKFLPPAFTKWFEFGTNPADWEEPPPDLEALIVLLKEQQDRLLSITPDQFEDRFDHPFYGFTAYGECAAFVAIHETLHVGKMEEMLRVIRQRTG